MEAFSDTTRSRWRTRVRRPIVVVSLLMVLGGVARADKLALLIGIGDYPSLYKLHGPRHDVEALREELVRSWGFARPNVETLLDADATKRGVLDAIDRLGVRTRPGDYVFLYYSGHGTSAFDDELRRHGDRLVGEWTGALMPYDYAAGLPERPSTEQWARGLIVGERDLRPRLEKLDRDRSVFVIFDTCFSGYTVRSVSENRARWVSPPRFSRTRNIRTRSIRFSDDPFEGPVFGAATASKPEYPYAGLIYLSAARRKERAEEMPGRYTVDGRPHGALTNALLKGLRGAADADGDHRLTYQEIYEYVRVEVSEHHLQMPQLLFPKGRTDLVDRSVFRHDRRRPTDAALPASAREELRVRLGPGLEGLRRSVAALNRIRVVDREEPHVLLRRDADGLVGLYHPSGDRIAGGFSERLPRRLLERLERQAQAQVLIDLAYPRQEFSLSLELPDGQGYLYGDERFQVTARADRPAVLLLLNIDKTGTVTVLYPMTARELEPSTGLREALEVIPPYGTEYLKLFAFSRPPDRLTSWINQKIDVLDPRFGDLLELLERPGAARAQTRLKVVSTGELVGDERTGWPIGRGNRP